jgi:hypothetical protein
MVDGHFARIYLIAVLLFATAAFLMARFTGPGEPQRVLGRAFRRYTNLPGSELAKAFHEASRRAFLSPEGVIAILLCGFVWAVSIRYAPAVERFLLSRGAAEGVAFIASVLPAIVMPLLHGVASRWLILRRLDRRFAELIAT